METLGRREELTPNRAKQIHDRQTGGEGQTTRRSAHILQKRQVQHGARIFILQRNKLWTKQAQKNKQLFQSQHEAPVGFLPAHFVYI